MPKSRSLLLRVLIASLVVAVLAVGGWRLLGDGGRPAAAVRTAEIERGTVRVAVAATGSLAAVSTVDVGTQVSGQLIELMADFNSRVQAGDTIARIDPKPFQARVTQAAADLASAEAGLASARAQRIEAEQIARNAERDYERRRKVRERGLISEVDLDAGLLARDQALAGVEVAKAAIRTAEAGVAQRRAALDNAQFDLARTEIRSPVDGVVIARAVSRGQTVAASLQTPLLFQIAEDLSKMQIVLAIDEADIGQVQPGQPATFTVDAFPRRRYQGRVEQVRLAVTNVSNVITYPVVIAVDNADLSLLPGMTANAEIEISARDDVLRVPNAALRFTPPQEIPAGGFPGDRRGGGRRDGGRDTAAAGSARFDLAAELTTRLSLDDAQRARLQELLQSARGGRGGAAGGPPDMAAIEDRMRERTQRLAADLRPLLRDDQQQALDAWLEERARTRTATVYVPDAGRPSPRRVRIGISDGQYTEVVGGELKEGDAVVVGLAAAGP